MSRKTHVQIPVETPVFQGYFAFRDRN
jgi:hypothetical protein